MILYCSLDIWKAGILSMPTKGKETVWRQHYVSVPIYIDQYVCIKL